VRSLRDNKTSAVNFAAMADSDDDDLQDAVVDFAND
jgi:hypothetical protein